MNSAQYYQCLVITTNKVTVMYFIQKILRRYRPAYFMNMTSHNIDSHRIFVLYHTNLRIHIAVTLLSAKKSFCVYRCDKSSAIASDRAFAKIGA